MSPYTSKKLGVALGAVLALAPALGRAAGTVPFAVPDSPAFTLLQTTPSEVSRPGNTRDLSVQLLSAIGADGRVKQGFALDARPWFLIPNVSIPLERYRQWPGFLLANLQLSLGSVQSSLGGVAQGDAPDTGATDLAVGLRATLYDAGDPMLSPEYTQRMADLMLECAPAQPGTPAEPGLACMAERTRELREQWLKEHWNATRLSLATASAWNAPGSVLEEARWSGIGIWMMGSLGLGTWGQLIGQVRYDYRDLNRRQALSLGSRFLFGSGDVNGFVEFTGTSHLNAESGTDRFVGHWAGGAEFRIHEQTWISAGFGSSALTENEPDPVSVIANIRWSMSDEARLRP